MTAAAATLGDRCPRCGGQFHCGAHDDTPCACSTSTLAPELLSELRQRYSGCLCLRCLQALAATAGVPADGGPVSRGSPAT